MFKVKNIHL
ncbi:UNVERIFIED_CONTAM: hypothetical protein GTU68_059229 [Idotea baltica]|nr:hypothetical protein [Idotea baltica]